MQSSPAQDQGKIRMDVFLLAGAHFWWFYSHIKGHRLQRVVKVFQKYWCQCVSVIWAKRSHYQRVAEAKSQPLPFSFQGCWI